MDLNSLPAPTDTLAAAIFQSLIPFTRSLVPGQWSPDAAPALEYCAQVGGVSLGLAAYVPFTPYPANGLFWAPTDTKTWGSKFPRSPYVGHNFCTFADGSSVEVWSLYNHQGHKGKGPDATFKFAWKIPHK